MDDAEISSQLHQQQQRRFLVALQRLESQIELSRRRWQRIMHIHLRKASMTSSSAAVLQEQGQNKRARLSPLSSSTSWDTWLMETESECRLFAWRMAAVGIRRNVLEFVARTTTSSSSSSSVPGRRVLANADSSTHLLWLVVDKVGHALVRLRELVLRSAISPPSLSPAPSAEDAFVAACQQEQCRLTEKRRLKAFVRRAVVALTRFLLQQAVFLSNMTTISSGSSCTTAAAAALSAHHVVRRLATNSSSSTRLYAAVRVALLFVLFLAAQCTAQPHISCVPHRLFFYF